ncbi:MAG: PilZ domain-containing protein [Candidatus Kariarchaeaceae archaeon]|jgi:hypothetical protein
MDEVDRRKHTRVETRNLIPHKSISKEGRIVSRSIGKSLNVSRSGILLETENPILEEYVLIMAVDLDNNLIELKGRLIYCRETPSGMYQAGIKFIGSEDEKAMFAVNLIKLYHRKLIMQDAA